MMLYNIFIIFSAFSACSVAKRKLVSTTVERSLQINPYFKKQTQLNCAKINIKQCISRRYKKLQNCNFTKTKPNKAKLHNYLIIDRW
jgi:hypothetical protein